MKKIIANISYGISIGLKIVPELLAIGLAYAIKFILGMVMCLPYPFEFVYLRLTQKEKRWAKCMYIPGGWKFAFAQIELF